MTLLLIVVLQKRRLKESENRDLNARLEHEKKIQQIKEEQHQEDIQSKIREITSYSLLLSNKNNVLQQLQEEISHLSNQKEDANVILKKATKIIQSNLNTDDDWNTFMLHFDNVHPQFFERLKQQCNGLTENNLRLCAYFRIGMQTKQIAQILNVTPETIKTIRHRLKRKLDLPENENLDNFLRKI